MLCGRACQLRWRSRLCFQRLRRKESRNVRCCSRELETGELVLREGEGAQSGVLGEAAVIRDAALLSRVTVEFVRSSKIQLARAINRAEVPKANERALLFRSRVELPEA